LHVFFYFVANKLSLSLSLSLSFRWLSVAGNVLQQTQAIKQETARDKRPITAYIWSSRVPRQFEVVCKVVLCGKLLVASVCLYYKCNFLWSWTVNSGFLPNNKSLLCCSWRGRDAISKAACSWTWFASQRSGRRRRKRRRRKCLLKFCSQRLNLYSKRQKLNMYKLRK